MSAVGHFSVFAPYLHPVHFSTFDPKVRHFSASTPLCQQAADDHAREPNSRVSKHTYLLMQLSVRLRD